MANNPLAPRKSAAAAGPHPMMGHAQMWQHVSGMAPEDQEAKTTELGYVLPLIGALAGNPKITRKDVIRAAADAAGSGKIPPSQAVSFISQMPEDPDKLQPWLHGIYAANITALVHLKVAQMPGQPAPQQPGAQPMPLPAPQQQATPQ